MKMTKRIFSLVLCLALCFSLALPALAAGETYTLTIENKKDGHTYEAYQIFSGALAINEGGKPVLSDIQWGTGVKNGTALLGAINGDPNLAALHGATNAEDLATKLSYDALDEATVIAFAELVGSDAHRGIIAGSSTDEGDVYTIKNLAAGYYLVMDKKNSLDGQNDAYTKYILRVLKNEKVTPKGQIPSVEKTINDTLGGTFTDVEDFDINDTAYYKWEGTLPSDLKEVYDSYYYAFTDTITSPGLEILEVQQIYIEGHDGNLIHTFLDITDADDTNNTAPAGINITKTATSLKVEFVDLMASYSSILPTQKVIVKYTARVTRDALIATAMENAVYLEFSNNPQGDGKGKTPEDKVYAFTFQLGVDKFDGDQPTKKLADAEFVLYYQRTEGGAIVNYYAQVVTEEMVYKTVDGVLTTELRPESERMINGKAVDGDDIGVVYGWTKNRDEASVLDTNADGSIALRGLDTDIYYLEEIKAPPTYNLLKKPIQINLEAAYTSDETSATAIPNYTIDSAKDQDTNHVVSVANSAGSTLPTTGGVGT